MNTDGTVKQIGDLSGIIHEYGPAIVILSAFLILFTILLIVLIKNNQKYIDRVAAQNDALFKKLFMSLPKKNYREEDIVEIFTKLNDIFREECKKINKKTGASRTAIYVFHNGTVASHGLPFFKMTCVSEWISRNSGFSEQMSKHTNLNLALFSSLINVLYNNGEYVSIIGDNNVPEPYTYAFISDRAKTSIFVCVYDGNNRIMAFINAEFKEIINDSEIDDIKLLVRDSCAKIRPVLEFSSYKSKSYS